MHIIPYTMLRKIDVFVMSIQASSLCSFYLFSLITTTGKYLYERNFLFPGVQRAVNGTEMTDFISMYWVRFVLGELDWFRQFNSIASPCSHFLFHFLVIRLSVTHTHIFCWFTTTNGIRYLTFARFPIRLYHLHGSKMCGICPTLLPQINHFNSIYSISLTWHTL